MEAKAITILNFLKKSPQFVVPIYQRTYSWTERECQRLWSDIQRVGQEEKKPAHFIGSIVYIAKGPYHVSSQSKLLVIDGQQRLTTTMLIIEALSRRLESYGNTEPLEEFSAKKLRGYYLLNPLEKEERRYKLLLTQTDKRSMLAILDQKPLPEEESVRIKENFNFFENKIKALTDAELISICKGLSKLMVVDITLNRNQDNPQVIFESLNSTGLELSQADLIRNFILMNLERGRQTKLYENFWRPMEKAFGQKAYTEEFDSFIRHYLTLKTGEIPNIRKVYEEFKRYSHKRNDLVENLVEEIHTFAKYYCAIALGKEENIHLQQVFDDLNKLKVDVSYPFILQLYHDYKTGILLEKDFQYIVLLVESYVFRRAVCGIPTNSLNKTFAAFPRHIDKTNYRASIEAHFASLSHSRSFFPENSDFCKIIKVRDLYSGWRKRCHYYLNKIENYDRKERVNEYTVEHILPQNENLSQEWQKELGVDWKNTQEKYLHTLGNLTLTGYNAEYSDRPFQEKLNIKGGFKESPLRLNESVKKYEVWNEKSITERAEELAQKALSVWPALPSSSYSQSSLVKSEQRANSRAMKDYPNLTHEPVQSLFKALQKEILSLSTLVKESFKPQYISYSEENNFVYVLPQKKQLKLFIGLDIHEVDSSLQNKVKDAIRAHYGNCNVEVDLVSLEQLFYVMGLIRQALEKQTGDDNNM